MSVCPKPVAWGALVSYWAGDLDGAPKQTARYVVDHEWALI